jgi:AcrR family transcriptional regulator
LGSKADLSLALRKKPVQERSAATFRAICEATIQVLLAGNFERLTTTRVAERAGVSVGTLYQYFPNKNALLMAVLTEHLGSVVEAVEQTCLLQRGRRVSAMVEAVCDSYIDAKLNRLDESRALYRPTAELGCEAVVLIATNRACAAIEKMLATASDALFRDLPMISKVLVSALIGPMQAVMDMGAPPGLVRKLRKHLVALCFGYLNEIRLHSKSSARS